MFVSTAYAQTAAPAAGGGDMLIQFAPLILIFVVFYFLLIRPQQKKMKEHKAMLEALRRGDRVVTGGGIIGTVIKVDTGDEVVVEIAEGVRVRCLRSTINLVLAKTEPAKGGETGEKPAA
ncbi:MAG TPA: preprotein translocase subunit YajC [Azospirillum sp.]